MRVLAAGNMYPPHHFGGYELVWRSAMHALRARGHDVHVLTTDLRTDTADPDDAGVHRELRWHWRPGGFARQSRRERVAIARHNHRVLVRHLDAFRPDVVSWWSMGGLSLAMIETVRRRGLPAVGFVHDDWMDYGRHVDGWLQLFAGRKVALASLAERLTGVPARVELGAAALWVFVSEATRRHARDLGLALVRTAVAHSGIDPAFLDPAAPHEWRWRLLYVGRLDERKGVHTAIEALPHLPGEARLRIAGGWDAAEEARLRDLAARLGAAGRVRFEGQIGREELHAAYGWADAVVFPVIWEEPWGLVPLEAMARGRPVVATGRGGSAEYLRDGENCLLFEATDAAALGERLRRLAADAELRARLRTGGIDTAPRHTSDRFDEAVERHLSEAMGAEAPRRRARPSPPVPELSVVVPTYRRRDALPRTLDALGDQSAAAKRFEVIVVDDPVDDDSEAVAAAVRAAARPFEVRQLHREARGVSAARNAGWRAARGRIVMFIGDDILPARDMLERHLAWHEREPADEVGVLGRVEWAGELRVTPFMRWLERGIQFDYRSLDGREAPWTHFYTSNVSLKRAMLERVDGFDEERFPFLYEDLDVGRRLSEHGFRLLYDDTAVGEHLHPTGIDEWRRRMAATAGAERRWVAAYPDMPAWFHDLFEDAVRRRRVPAPMGRVAARIPARVPVIGPRAAALADLHFRQQLAPDYLAAWRREAG